MSFPAVLVERFAPRIFGSTWLVEGDAGGGFVFGRSGLEDMVVCNVDSRVNRVVLVVCLGVRAV